MLELHIVKDVLDWKVFDLTIIELTGNINILKTAPGQFYISILNGEDSIFAGSMSFGGGACPNVKYRTQIKSEDVNGNETTGIPVEVVKKNGYAYRSGTTPHVVYLYDGVYNVTATISGKKVSKSVVVNKAPTTVVVSPSSADGMINGKVLDSETREPVIGASVVISMGDMAFADSLSDSAGGYTAHLPAGTYRVAIYKDGYVPFLTYVTVDEDDIEYLETTMMVEGDVQAMGGFAGQITNALDGTPVSEVKLQVRKGWNNTTEGDVVVTLKSDSNGHFESKTGNLFGVMIGLSAGNYTLSATKSGYVTTSCNVVVEPGVVKTGQNFTMSPALESEEYRVVLRWGSSPSDLDSHYSAITESGNRDHVYYSNRTGYTANLDRDDTDYEGPETITVTDFGALPNGFTYSVHDFTNRDSTSSTALSNSGAYVEVYCGDTLLQTYHVPTGKVGTVWNVFSVDGNGNLISRNTFENISNPESVGPTYSTATVIAAAPVLESVPPKSYAKQ